MLFEVLGLSLLVSSGGQTANETASFWYLLEKQFRKVCLFGFQLGEMRKFQRDVCHPRDAPWNTPRECHRQCPRDPEHVVASGEHWRQSKFLALCIKMRSLLRVVRGVLSLLSLIRAMRRRVRTRRGVFSNGKTVWTRTMVHCVTGQRVAIPTLRVDGRIHSQVRTGAFRDELVGL